MWGEKSWALWHKKGVKVQGGPGGTWTLSSKEGRGLYELTEVSLRFCQPSILHAHI